MRKDAIKVLNPRKRASDEQACREQDRLRVQSGMVSREQLRQENGFCSGLLLHSFRIAAISGRRVGTHRWVSPKLRRPRRTT